MTTNWAKCDACGKIIDEAEGDDRRECDFCRRPLCADCYADLGGLCSEYCHDEQQAERAYHRGG
jgi:hypothetical protein